MVHRIHGRLIWCDYSAVDVGRESAHGTYEKIEKVFCLPPLSEEVGCSDSALRSLDLL